MITMRHTISFSFLVQSVFTFPGSNTASKSASGKPSIQWSDCSIPDAPTLECGSINVPLDYSGKVSGTVNLGLVRLRASNPSKRVGSLLYNPGGPGYGGLELMIAAAQGIPVFSDDILSRYDFINFDPRGTGQSSPVMCDPAIANVRVSYFPTMQKGYADLVAYNKAFGASCAKLTGPLINFLDTTTVAKDLELVRQALDNGAKLNFFGQSYGSQVGLQYAEQYPQNINRMALDGILDHTMSETSTLYTESGTYERVLNAFFDWCAALPSCALHGQNAAAVFDTLTDLSKPAIPAPGCTSTGDYACRSDVTREEIRSNVQGFLLFQNLTSTIFDGWDLLAEAMAEAAKGNATLLSTPLATSNTSEYFSSLAIGCQDWSHNSASLNDLVFKSRMAASLNPHTQGSTQSYLYQAGCIGWPAPNTNPQKPLSSNIQNAPPILLVQSTIDPSCSIVWATDIQAQLPKSIMLTREGAGHTSYHLMGASTKAIDNFLINGVFPAQGTYVNS